MTKYTIGVLGIGEVGKAISQIFSSQFKVLKKDSNFDQLKNTKIDVLHVCIPYTNSFINSVISQVEKNRPNLIIIHANPYSSFPNNGETSKPKTRHYEVC